MFGEQANLPIQSTRSSYLNKSYLLWIIIKKKIIINVKWKRIVSKEIPFSRTMNFLHVGYIHIFFIRTHQIFLSVARKNIYIYVYTYNNNSIKIIEKWLTRENKWNKNFYPNKHFPKQFPPPQNWIPISLRICFARRIFTTIIIFPKFH